jgi:ATP-dependent Lon protease
MFREYMDISFGEAKEGGDTQNKFTEKYKFDLKSMLTENIEIVVMLNKYETIICNLYLTYLQYKNAEIISMTDYNIIIDELDLLIMKLRTIGNMVISSTEDDEKSCFILLQEVNDKLSHMMKQYGAESIDDLLHITVGEHAKNEITECHGGFYKHVINKYVHPINYKVITWSAVEDNKLKNRNKQKSNLLEDIYLAEIGKTMDVYELTKFSSDTIDLKINGVKLIIRDENKKQTIIIQGYLDNIPLEYIRNVTLLKKRGVILDNVPNQEEFNNESFTVFLNALSLKEVLVNSHQEIYEIYVGYRNNVKTIKKKSLAKVSREFIQSERYDQRQTILQLLIFSNDFELQFMAYLLYDMLSFDNKTPEDSPEQKQLYDSLPSNLKLKFKNAMRETIDYTTKLMNYDIQNNLPLEQRICLMKTNDSVKEKAMMKLKELKSKSEDSGSKARQYLDGLLKIPFNVYREEPILTKLETLNDTFKRFMSSSSYKQELYEIPLKESYNNSEILYHIRKYCKVQATQEKPKEQPVSSKSIEPEDDSHHDMSHILSIMEHMKNMSKEEIIHFLDTLNASKYKHKIRVPYYSEYYKLHELNDVVYDILQQCITDDSVIAFLHDSLIKPHTSNEVISMNVNKQSSTTADSSSKEIDEINKKCTEVTDYFKDIRQVLDDSVYGHEEAKRQIERIIGQWINGESSGYCFGFEGPPGTGKTSIAKKGLSQCLKDENGVSRPFAFIGIGGSSNGSTLDGHNYTYVGSMWGKIVDVLMETKCMNPIIFIDEIDKVSRTEAGREIISILTHLVDSTQNDKFQDKYFSGIDLDLSKALFVFSYNDVNAMDRILLDRIHRIKFSHLSLEEKLIISKNYLLPEILDKMGQKGNIVFTDQILTFLINSYTCEAGVRKLKQLLFEIVGELNLVLLRSENDIQLPVEISEDDITKKYLKTRNRLKPKRIHECDKVGIMNGLWANAMGMGGIIPIEAQFMISDKVFEMKLTGSQGDVMKESMNVSKTLAWNLLTDSERERVSKQLDISTSKGVHIHCPEGAVPKDGPSAGTAITVTLYSLLSGKKIDHTLAITGEINLQGKVTAIGGLDLKILGGIEAGVKTFLFPKENEEDFNKFMEKNEKNQLVKGINFHIIETVQEAIKYAIVS